MTRRGPAARRFSRSNPRWVALAVAWGGVADLVEDSLAAVAVIRAVEVAIPAEAAVIQVVAAVTQVARMATGRSRRLQ